MHILQNRSQAVRFVLLRLWRHKSPGAWEFLLWYHSWSVRLCLTSAALLLELSLNWRCFRIALDSCSHFFFFTVSLWQYLGHCPLPFTQDCFKWFLPHKCPKALLSTTSCRNVLSSVLYSALFAFCNPYGRQTDEIKMLASFPFCLWHPPSRLLFKPVSSILPQFSKSALSSSSQSSQLNLTFGTHQNPEPRKPSEISHLRSHSCPVDRLLAISVSLVLP